MGISFFSRVQVFFTVFFAFNFLFELLLSKNRWAFVMSILGIVDLVTIVPVFVALATEPLVKSPTGFVRLHRALMLSRVRIALKNIFVFHVLCDDMAIMQVWELQGAWPAGSCAAV